MASVGMWKGQQERYPGTNVSYEEIARAFSKFIRDDPLVGAFSGRIYRYQGSGRYAQPGGVRLTDYLLLTRCHVVFWGRGVYGQTIEAIRYQDISDVAYTSGMIFGEIVLGTRAGQKKFGDMYHSDVPVAADMIRETMRSCQKPDQTKVRYEEEQSIGKPLPGASLVSVVDAFVYPGVQGTS